MHTLLVRSIPKVFIAFSSFNPPRLTYLSSSPLNTISASTLTFSPALSTLCPSTKISPAIILVFALSLDVQIPLSTNNTSNLSFFDAILFSFIHNAYNTFFY